MSKEKENLQTAWNEFERVIGDKLPCQPAYAKKLWNDLSSAIANVTAGAADVEIKQLQATNASLLAALERIAASDTARAPGVIARAAIASAKEAGKQ